MAWIREGKRERRRRQSEQWPDGGAAMADGKDLAGARETRPRSLGFRIREHRGIEGVKETSARPRMGPVDAVGAVVAMAGGRSSRAHAKRPLEAMKREINITRRERGEWRSSQ